MSSKRIRRTADQRIAALKAEIEKIKVRANQQKIKKDPALRHISGAIRAIEKALGETKDNVTRSALMEARTALSACLTLSGGGGATSNSRGAGRPDPDKILDYIRKHPSSRSEEICGELGTDAASLRPVLHRLRDEGRVRVAGKARATRYSAQE